MFILYCTYPIIREHIVEYMVKKGKFFIGAIGRRYFDEGRIYFIICSNLTSF